MRRVVKCFAILAAGFLTLCIAGAAFVESRFFKDWLRDHVVELCKSHVRGELSLGRLEGNLFRQLELGGDGHDLAAETLSRLL